MIFKYPRLGNTINRKFTKRSDPIYGCPEINKIPKQIFIPLGVPRRKSFINPKEPKVNFYEKIKGLFS